MGYVIFQLQFGNKKMLNILLTGHFSSLNKGDEARVKSAVRMLKSRFSDATITFLTSHPERDALIYRNEGIRTISRYGDQSRRRDSSKLVKALELALVLLGAAIYSVSRRKVKLPTMARFIEYDVFVDVSGESLTEYYGAANLLQTLHPLILGRFLGAKVVVFSQTIGPINSSLLRRLMVLVLNRVSLVGVRDKSSYEFAREYGVSRDLISLVADQAFTFKPGRNDAETTSIAGRIQEARRNTAGPQIGFCIGVGGYRRILGSTGDVSKHTQDYLGVVGATIEDLILNKNATIWFVTHVLEAGQDERKVYRELASRVGNHERLILISPDLNSEFTKAIIGEFDAFVSSRMHACIAAISMNVPTIGLAFSEKLVSLMERVGVEDFCIAVSRLDAHTLSERINKLLLDHDDVSARLARANKDLADESWKMVSAMEGILRLT